MNLFDKAFRDPKGIPLSYQVLLRNPHHLYTNICLGQRIVKSLKCPKDLYGQLYKLPLQICWKCRATKGLDGPDSLARAFTNVSMDAPYWDTMHISPPWSFTPCYTQLSGFREEMIHPDLLHVFHLGVGRDLAASSIVYMLRQPECGHIFAGNNLDEKLRSATSMVKMFAKERKLNLKLHKFSRSKLHMSTKSYPELCSNGYDTYVVLAWLETVVTAHSDALPRELCAAIWAANHVLSLLQAGGRFLSPEEQGNKETFGQLFMVSYVHMARVSLVARTRLFRMRPKLHILHHIFKSRPRSGLNPWNFNTFMDEDALKKLMKVLKIADNRTAPERLLQRFLIKLPGFWDAKRRKPRAQRK